MKEDKRSSRASSAKKSRQLRYLDLSFEGKDLVFKNDEMDNGKLPHGGYKGSKKHPMGIYSWDRGKDYQRQLQEDLHNMLETEMLGVHGSPQWSLEAHKQPTHSGESPLLLNKFLSPSKHEAVNGTGRWLRNSGRTGRNSAPPCTNGVKYYRPNRMHQYLTATELKDASDCDEVLRYGRPTRTTLLRARQRTSNSANSYTSRRHYEQKMDELKRIEVVPTPKELTQLQSEVEGETVHSFLTGARYNRAHCLDSKSLTQYGVYMPRENPLACFVLGNRVDLLDTTSAPPESPRSDIVDSPKVPPERRRPTTAPGYGRKTHMPAPPFPSSPRQAWGDASSSLHITNGDNHQGEGGPIMEEIRVWSPRLNVKGSRFPLSMNREGPVRFESKLPSVHGTTLSRRHKLKDIHDGSLDANQPPPSLADQTAAREDDHLPAVNPEPETEVKSDAPKPEEETASDLKPVNAEPVTVPSLPTSEPEGIQEEAAGVEEEQKEVKNESQEVKVETSEAAVILEEEKEEKEWETPEEQSTENQAESTPDDVQTTDDVTEAPTTEQDDVKTGEEGKTSEHTTPAEKETTEGETANTAEEPSEQKEEKDVKETSDDVTEPADDVTQSTDDAKKNADDVKFFLTEEGVVGEQQKLTEGENGDGDELKDTIAASDSKSDTEVIIGKKEEQNTNVKENLTQANSVTRKDSADPDDLEQSEGQEEPLKVIVTHVEKSMGAPVSKDSD